MDAIIDDICAVGFIFCFEVGIEAALDAFQDGFPAGMG
jgi:hypothetical protein